jgi:PAS domain S-box-containing protein
MGRKPTYEQLQQRVQKLTEKAPQNNLSLMEALINTIPNPVFYKDKHGMYQGCNQAFAGQIFGLTKEKILGCSLFDLSDAVPSDLAQIYHQKDDELIKNPGTQIYESQVQCADGVRRDFLFKKATYTDAWGNITGIIGVMLDITDTKRTKQALRESEARYRALFENMSNGVAIYKAINDGEDFLLINFNKAA